MLRLIQLKIREKGYTNEKMSSKSLQVYNCELLKMYFRRYENYFKTFVADIIIISTLCCVTKMSPNFVILIVAAFAD